MFFAAHLPDRFKAGEAVIQEGDSGNAFFIIKSGLPFLFCPQSFRPCNALLLARTLAR
jgi:hypothetical protein